MSEPVSCICFVYVLLQKVIIHCFSGASLILFLLKIIARETLTLLPLKKGLLSGNEAKIRLMEEKIQYKDRW
jgi:hypothetical protein